MIPSPLTWGHVLMLAGLVALAYAAWQLYIHLSHRAHGPGTPGYARARDGRRYALLGALIGAALFALGCLTPLCEVPLA